MKIAKYFLILILLLCFVNPGCKQQDGKSIGTATMKDDGTIIMMLRAEDPSGGAMGDAMFIYKPDDPKYQEILKHLGGLKPGETKPVPPWPE